VLEAVSMSVDGEIKQILLDRAVLVTGAAGFVGSHMVDKLLEYGACVHVFVRATSSGTHHNLSGVLDKITIHRGDLSDKRAVLGALVKVLESGCRRPIIFHLGAQAHVGESWSRPYETLHVNLMGTVNLLQSLVDLKADVYRVDVAGSSEEFGNVRDDVRHLYRYDEDGHLLLDECSPLNPQSIYATAKVGADFATRNYHKAYGLPTIVTRMFNNYGPRQSPRFITGTIISQALSRDDVRLGYMLSKRDFCYVSDGVMGHLHTTLFGTPGDVYVYGYGKNITMLEWYELIIRIGKEHGYWGDKILHADTEGRGRLGHSEVEELLVDYSKLNKLTGWKPQYSWEQGISETIKWYAENRDKWVGRVDWR